MPELSRGIISYLKLSKSTVDEMPYNRNHSGLDVRLSEQEQSPGMIQKSRERGKQNIDHCKRDICTASNAPLSLS